MKVVPLRKEGSAAQEADVELSDDDRAKTVFVSTQRANKPRRPQLDRGEILTAEGPILNHSVAERFRILRAKVERRNLTAKNKVQVVAVTSALPQEGKSVTSVNLARAFGRNPTGKTLLIDCDLRKPSVHKYFGMSHENGLSDVLVSGKPLQSVIRSVEPGLDMITAGRLIGDPARAIEQPLFKHYLHELKKYYNFIILDCPPALLCPEPIAISTVADSTIVVVRAWRTERGLVKDTINLIGKSKVLGIVMNDAVESSRQHGYYEYYGYTYGRNAPGPEQTSSLEQVGSLFGAVLSRFRRRSGLPEEEVSAPSVE